MLSFSKKSALAVILALVLFCPAGSAEPPEIVCQGMYQHHLQGIAGNQKDTLFWSFTTTLVKTDIHGKVLVKVPVKNHHGDLCFSDGKVFVAYSNLFNRPGADSKVYIYNAEDLAPVDVKRLPEVVYGAGGIECHEGHFFVVGGLPPDHTRNYVHEYDRQFKYVTRHIIESGYTRLGIQAVCHHDGYWWFGCYGKRGLLKTEDSFKLLGGYKFYAGIGLVGWGKGRLLVARHFGNTSKGKYQAKAVWAGPDDKLGLAIK